MKYYKRQTVIIDGITKNKKDREIMRTVMRLSKSNLLEKRIVFPLKNLQPQKSPAVAAAPLPLIQTKCVCEGGCPSCQKPKLTIGKPDDKHEQKKSMTR